MLDLINYKNIKERMFFENIIVGAGLAGSTIARLLADKGEDILIIDKRSHIAGNTYDFLDENEILVQKYGPHIFHTNNEEVWAFLSRFTEWNNYTHRVLACVDGKKVSVPINQDTINILYSKSYDTEELIEFYNNQKIDIAEIKNSRDVIVSQVGEDIYEKIFKNYTKKQWGVYPDELEPEVIARVPVRTNNDSRYFTDRYQGMPQEGYTQMIQNMLDHPKIKILLNTDFLEIQNELKFEKLIFTGCIDEFFKFKFGKLPYRCLNFKFETVDKEFYQEAAVVNYPNDYDFTRITEFKHWTYQKRPNTTIVKEYSSAEGDPYYPVPQKENYKLYEKYKKEAESLEKIYFAGRLGCYKYFNMDKVVEESMKLFHTLY